MRSSSGWRKAFYHLILIACSLFFSLPFLWMISTSFKADDEIIHDPIVWIPEIPMRVVRSPYLDPESHPPRWRKPSQVDDRRWPSLQKKLKEELQERCREIFDSPQWSRPKRKMEPSLFVLALSDIADSVWEKVNPRIPTSAWNEEDPTVPVLERVTVADVRQAWNRFFRTLEIGDIHLRNRASRDIGRSPAPEDARVPYDFETSDSLLLCERRVPLASPEEELDQVMVRIKGDASFHQLDAELEWDGKTYRTDHPFFLGSGNVQDVFWKFTEQKDYDIEHLTFIEKKGAPSSTGRTEAVLRFHLKRTPYSRVLWERFSDSYREVFFWVPYATYMWVTTKLTFLNIVGQIFACSFVAFAFAKLRFPGRDLFFVLMLSTMMLPPQVTMVPQFVLFSKLGTYNTLFPLYILSFAGAPFFVFLMRQFYRTIPDELTEAAKIDGCNYFQIYWRVMLPLVKPALAAIAIFQFQATWNEFLQPLIYIADTDKTPISVGLFLFRQSHGGLTSGGGMWAELMAASTLMTLPVVILFFFTQRYFIQGVTLTGLKG